MKRITLLIAALLTTLYTVRAQDEEAGLQIYGSVDTYWKYDFSGYQNIPTSFADEQNSISIGMLDLGLTQTIGKASFTGELSFGPRSFKSIPLFNVDNESDPMYVGLQNLYVSYAFSDLFSLTAGYMATFVGYEVISPTGNFNYSTSYLFTNGPFQNSGIKADFTISDRFSFMVGLFNDWNVYQDFNGISDLGAQVHFVPVEGWDVYLNLITGDISGTEVDLTTGFQITDALYLGLNAADYTAVDDAGGFSGVALYPQVSLSDAVALGMRYEYFKLKNNDLEGGGIGGELAGGSVNGLTLTANLKAGPLTLLPEVRLDNATVDIFSNSEAMPAGSASQFLIAAVYAF